MDGLLEGLKASLEAGDAVAYLIVLLFGIVTSFTPCIYPVIPITVGYIGANASGSKGKGFLLSISYVIGIAVTYSILGGIAAMTGTMFGSISTNPISYFIIANICILLGISMLGVFELRLPSFLTRPRGHTGSGAGKSGGSVRQVAGSLAMGLAAGLVVGPCTAPVLAVVLAFVASRQNIIYGASILFTFALGMGFLLVILGTFTGLLVSMPKPGPWLNRVKKGFGWVLIIAGEYFLIRGGILSV
jgi:thiol:disulfide interchange protein DsbD